ncbi:MAG: hypothetical protein LBF83_02010, partial [Spirochaetaceae bacterium]|nr:hypothetical protein [Spirochaetaceae bacterium]
GTVRLLDELYAERIRFADFEGEEWIAITPSNSGDINVVTMSLPAMNCGVSLVERRGGSLKPVDGFQQVVPPYFG